MALIRIITIHVPWRNLLDFHRPIPTFMHTSIPALALLCSLAVVPYGASRAQNLVPNPGFEIQDTCPAVSQIFLAQPWSSANTGTPDLYNTTCSTQNGPGRTGIGSAGVSVYYESPVSTREYLQAPLTSPLTAGEQYCVSFWVLRQSSQLASDGIGAYLGVGPIDQSDPLILSVTPQVEHPAGQIISGPSWTNVLGQFTATGGEDHIIIGNFRNNTNTVTEVVNPQAPSPSVYLKIDDVYVGTCIMGSVELLSAQDARLFPQPATDFLNVEVPAWWHLHTMEVIGMDGRIIKQQKVTASDRHSLELSQLPTGMYVLRMHTPHMQVSKRFVH